MDKEAKIFKVLADPIRLRLAVLLAQKGEMCVCNLSDALDEPQFKISRHLGILRNAGLVRARRESTWMHYQLTEPDSVLLHCLHDCFRQCLADLATAKADRKRLKQSKCKT